MNLSSPVAPLHLRDGSLCGAGHTVNTVPLTTSSERLNIAVWTETHYHAEIVIINKPFRYIGLRDRSDLNTLVISTRIGRIGMSCAVCTRAVRARWLLAQLRGFGFTRPSATAHIIIIIIIIIIRDTPHGGALSFLSPAANGLCCAFSGPRSDQGSREAGQSYPSQPGLSRTTWLQGVTTDLLPCAHNMSNRLIENCCSFVKYRNYCKMITNNFNRKISQRTNNLLQLWAQSGNNTLSTNLPS